MFRFLGVIAIAVICFQPSLLAQPASVELARIKAQYSDVLALTGTAKNELLAIAHLLRIKPEMAIDRTAESHEYCLKTAKWSMVHYSARPETTEEDVVYEFDASQLIQAGLDPAQLPKLPPLGGMQSGRWYFLPAGGLDPHHGHTMSAPTIAIAVAVK